MSDAPLPRDVANHGSSLSFQQAPPTWAWKGPTAWTIVFLGFVGPLLSLFDNLGVAVGLGLIGLWLAVLWLRIALPTTTTVKSGSVAVRQQLWVRRRSSVAEVSLRIEEGEAVLRADDLVLYRGVVPWSGTGWSILTVRALAVETASLLGATLDIAIPEKSDYQAALAARWASQLADIAADIAVCRRDFPDVYDVEPRRPQAKLKLDKERLHVMDGELERGMRDTGRFSMLSHEPISIDTREVAVLGQRFPYGEIRRAFVLVETLPARERLSLYLLHEGERVLLMQRYNVGSAASEMQWIAQRVQQLADAARAVGESAEDIPDSLKRLRAPGATREPQ